eukprot:gene15993-16163_t
MKKMAISFILFNLVMSHHFFTIGWVFPKGFLGIGFLLALKHNLIEKGEATPLFGQQRDEHLKALFGNIHQTFDDVFLVNDSTLVALALLIAESDPKDKDLMIKLNGDRQLDGLKTDRTYTDKASGRDTNRPELVALLDYVRDGDTVKDSPMATLLLSVMGAFVEFERSLIRERQREGVAIAKAKGLYRGRKPKLNATQIEEAKAKIAMGVPKAKVARELSITRMTLYSSIGK